MASPRSSCDKPTATSASRSPEPLGAHSVSSQAVKFSRSDSGSSRMACLISSTVIPNNLSKFTHERADPSLGPAPCSFNLLYVFTALLAAPFAGQRGFSTLLFTRFQVVGMALDLLDDIFLLYLPLKPAKRALQGFPILHEHFSQKSVTTFRVRSDKTETS